MGGLTNASQDALVQSFRYQTSEQGDVIPIVYGTQRVTPNLIEAWGLSPSGGGKGGKGGGSSGGKGKSQNTQYSVYVAFGICQGPIASFGDVWISQGVEAFSECGLASYDGADGQSPDPVFASKDPNSPVLGYSGTCYVTGVPLQLGSAPALPNYSFEVVGFCNGSNANFPSDANPRDIAIDFLTNARYGAGFPAANLDSAGSIADWGNYCAAAALMVSPVLDLQQDAGQYLDDLLTITNSAAVWSGNLLKIIPYGDQTLDANGVNWTPNLTPQYGFTDDDFIPWNSSGGEGEGGGGDDPVAVTRINPADAINWVAFEFTDRGNYYDIAIEAAFDQGAIDQFGLRMDAPLAAHGICQQGVASAAAQLLLQRKQYIRNTFKFQLGWKYCLLDPMDIVLLTDSGLGLSGAAVRITGIEENDNGELTVTAEEIPGITP